MFNPSEDTLQTPSRPPPTTTNDLLISFDTPSQNQQTMEVPGTSRKTLLDVDLDDLFGPTPNKSSREKYNDANSLSDLISSTLEAERSKWIHESEMRHAAEMEALAADLHTQYREKHTRKVDALKVTYKRQYEKKIIGLEEKLKEMEGVIEGLKEELEKEVKEKRELIEMSEELMRLTGTGNDSN
jgi:Fungal Transforming acidic coiled-coil (TACC) proteins